MSEHSATRLVAAADLCRFATDLLVAFGFPRAVAAQAAEVLVWAELRGHASHGVMRIPGYLAWARKGIIDIGATLTVARRKAAVTVLDAGRGLGPWVLAEAADIAVDRADETGVAWVAVREHSHAGAIGYFARRIAEHGMMAVVMTASRPLMPYHGTASPAIGTNPLAIALPGGWLLDMSSAAIPAGRIVSAAVAGTPLPAGVACDVAGNPTTDPGLATMPLPLGGPKGSGLSVMIEGLTSLALANPLIAPSLVDQRAGREIRHRQNGLIVAVDPAAFDADIDLAAATGELDAALKAEPRAVGVDDVLHPGERGDRMAISRLASGIPLSIRTCDRLAELAVELEVQPI